MNPAIEYMLRNKRIESLLSFPSALFLENKLTKSKKERKRSSPLAGKTVVVLAKQGDEMINVKHYELAKAVKGKGLPPYTETAVMRSEVFCHPDVILPDHRLIEFVEAPYTTPDRHYSELPQAPLQEKAYREARERFFNPKSLQRQREDWLWKAFEKVYGTTDDRKAYRSVGNPDVERELVRHGNKEMDKAWGQWKAAFLSFSGPAPELVFGYAFKSDFVKLRVKESKGTKRAAVPDLPMPDWAVPAD